MKFMFEVHTTSCKPIYIYLDEKIRLTELYETISIDIENNTMLTRSDVLDIFVQNHDETKSIPKNHDILDEFLEENPKYFTKWNGSLHKNIHKLYIMDKEYITRIKNNKPAPIYTNEPIIENYSVVGLLKTAFMSIYL
jgi:hypothetical protein|uniref:Uncharacterized protein n=1 Tax=viral metagenome TaxID=1070528 RepID=A0A6C0IPV8_9ZZZZ